MATLPTVEVPGYREAVRKERTQRDRAFLGGNEIVFGVEVRQLSLRTALYLEHAENGFLIPYRYDDDVEVVAHALQVLWFSTPGWKCPHSPRLSLWRTFIDGVKQARFRRKVLRNGTLEQLVTEVRDWIAEATLDCPSGGSSEVPRSSYASHPAHLVDLFGAAGLPFSYDEILDMPLKRLWQHWKLAANRVYDVKLTNPSDNLAVEFIGRRGGS